MYKLLITALCLLPLCTQAQTTFGRGEAFILRDMQTQTSDTLRIIGFSDVKVTAFGGQLPRAVKFVGRGKTFLFIRDATNEGNFFRSGEGIKLGEYSGEMLSSDILSYSPTTSPKGLLLSCRFFDDVIIITDSKGVGVFELRKRKL